MTEGKLNNKDYYCKNFQYLASKVGKFVTFSVLSLVVLGVAISAEKINAQTTSPCTLTSAAWSSQNTTQNTLVTLNVTGSGNCAGQTVNFKVSRNGVSITGGNDVTTQPSPQTRTFAVNSTQVSTTWYTEHNPLLPNTDPQYYFEATVTNGNTVDTKNNLLTVTLSAGAVIPTSPIDWPQVQKDPQHTGYSAETMGNNVKVAWYHSFSPESVTPQVQAIAAYGRVYVGTEHGSMHALNATNGSTVWQKNIGAPILTSVAVYNNLVYFGAMDGAVYALDSATGSQVWKNQLSRKVGFSTSPVLASENGLAKIFLGGRNGIFYAINANTGDKLWEYNTGSPILQTAAYNNGRVFFGGMDMSIYALNTLDGSLAWKSPKVGCMAFKDYWPVVTGGKVLERSVSCQGINNFFAFDEATGVGGALKYQFDGFTMHGASSPPAVDRDGNLVLSVPRPPDATGVVNYGACWGVLNLATQTVVQILGGSPNPGAGMGCGNPDENQNASSANNMIFGLHVGDAGALSTAGSNGYFNRDTNTWVDLPIPNEAQHFPSHNVQGGGSNPASISNGMFYHISYNELIARSTR